MQRFSSDTLAPECNANPNGLSLEPEKFKLGFRIRDQAKPEEWQEFSRQATDYLQH